MRARCAAISSGKCRAIASSPAMALCATMGALAPEPLVIVTPRDSIATIPSRYNGGR